MKKISFVNSNLKSSVTDAEPCFDDDDDDDDRPPRQLEGGRISWENIYFILIRYYLQIK